MSLTFVCPDLRHGGAERQWSILIPGLRDRGVQPLVVEIGGRGHYAAVLEQQGIEVRTVGAASNRDIPKLVRALAATSRSRGIVTRAVNAHVIGALAARLTRSVHVTVEHTQYDLLPLNQRRRWIMRRLAPHVAGTIAVAEAQRRPLVEAGYHAERLHVVPNGLDAADVPVRRDALAVRREFAVDAGDVLAVLVAALRPEKRVDDFIAAVRLSREAGSPLRGLVIGDGVQRGALVRAAEGSGVVFAGARDDVGDFLNAADIVCLASVHEVASIALLEAMALGRPIVATDVGATAQLVIDGVTGRIVPPRDIRCLASAIGELANSQDLRTAWGTAGLERHRSMYGRTQMIDGYMRVLEELGAL